MRAIRVGLILCGLSLWVQLTSAQEILKGAATFPPLKGPVELITMPNPEGHKRFVTAIDNAQKVILMEMFHLTDQTVIDALLRAQMRGIDIKVILDHNLLAKSKYKNALDQLVQGGVAAKASSSGFSITHTKSMVIDGQTAFVTSINLTKTYATTRDFGIITADPGIIAEMTSVFMTDWQSADSGRADTPALSDPNLLWSPVDSGDRLKSLIDSAIVDIATTVENLGNEDIENALISAAKRGVRVRMIVPMCDLSPNPNRNLPYVDQLRNAGVQAQLMPFPQTAAKPYMHSKMMIVDGVRAYLGSVNFSFNSIARARELGILFSENQIIQNIQSVFETDWQSSLAPGAGPALNCPVF